MIIGREKIFPLSKESCKGGKCMKRQSRVFTGMLACVLGICAMIQPAYGIDIYYRNRKMPTDVDPVIENGRTLVPVAVIAEQMGAVVKWDQRTKKIRIEKEGLVLYLTLGRKDFGVESQEGGYTGLFDLPVKSIGGRTMVPLSTIAEVFGSKVQWDGATKSVLIDSDLSKIGASQKPQTGIKMEGDGVSRVRKALKNTKDYADLATLPMEKSEDAENWFAQINGLRERKPGRYELYEVKVEDGFSMYFALDLDKGKVYEVSRGVYALPDHAVVVPPQLDEQDSFHELFPHLLINLGKAGAENEFYVKTTAKNERGDYIAVWAVEVTVESKGKKSMVQKYEVDVFNRLIRDAKTKKVIFDDSAVQKYPEKQITKDNAGGEVIARLIKLKLLDEKGQYYAAEVSPFTAPVVENREGFLVDIRQQAPDPDVTNLVGSYFINTTGTVLMVFDPERDWYIYLYGEHTPMG